MINHVTSFKVCWWLVPAQLLFSLYRRQSMSLFLFLFSQCYNQMTLYNNRYLELGIGQQTWKCNKETKHDNIGNKIWIEHKWNSRRNSWFWECWPLTLNSRLTAWTADMQRETLPESKIIDVNKKSGCDKKG